ncbi:hypothetical protein [Pseudodesulfovibrio sp.]|uniref:hypothetical protein n=1 Tax=unclassified Pseudodesulfovibrio TaxID=2661612 RepID=UPI003AFFB703
MNQAEEKSFGSAESAADSTSGRTWECFQYGQPVCLLSRMRHGHGANHFPSILSPDELDICALCLLGRLRR